MNTLCKLSSALLISICSGINLNAQQENLKAAEAEIIEVLAMETQAFVSGDCDKVISFMDDEITFYANGKKSMPKDIIKKFCNNIPRPLEAPLAIDTKFYPLSENSGYTVRSMELKNHRQGHVEEVITKVWKKGREGWKMTHFHSTVKPVTEE